MIKGNKTLLIFTILAGAFILYGCGNPMDLSYNSYNPDGANQIDMPGNTENPSDDASKATNKEEEEISQPLTLEALPKEIQALLTSEDISEPIPVLDEDLPIVGRYIEGTAADECYSGLGGKWKGVCLEYIPDTNICTSYSQQTGICYSYTITGNKRMDVYVDNHDLLTHIW